jgi:hypothetical protein
MFKYDIMSFAGSEAKGQGKAATLSAGKGQERWPMVAILCVGQGKGQGQRHRGKSKGSDTCQAMARARAATIDVGKWQGSG